MGIYALSIALILGLLIIFVEIFRKKTKERVDILLGVNIIYFICYCIIPIFLLNADISDVGASSWIFKNSFESPVFLYASFISVIGYLSILIGYYNFIFIRSKKAHKTLNNKFSKREINISDKKILIWGNIIFFIGLASLIGYVKSIGGFWFSLQYADAFRGKRPPVISKFAFLKNIAPLIQIASYFFYGLAKKSKVIIVKNYSKIMFGMTFFLTLYILFHKAGRLSLTSYLIVFLLAKVIDEGKFSKKVIGIIIVLSVFIIIFGDSIFHIFLRKETFYDELNYFSSNLQKKFKLGLLEFSFPFITLANAIKAFEIDINMRLFVDIPLGLLHLLPQRLLKIELPETLSTQNSFLFDFSSGTIPVDILSFGYFSLGIAGVIITCFVFGIILRKIENKFNNIKSPIASTFKAEWIISLAFMIMYSDPQMIYEGRFSLIVGTLILILISKP